MIKINNRGFSLIELLIAIAILGILSGMAMVAFSGYTRMAKDKSFYNMAKSASVAAEQYIIDNPGTTKITFDELVNENYLSNVTNPYGDGTCMGRVKIKTTDSNSLRGLSENSFTVSVCCHTNIDSIDKNYTYFFPSGGSRKDDKCKALPYDLSEVGEVKVLNIYPNKGNNFATWMSEYADDTQIGKGLINVTAKSISDFNVNSSAILGDPGSWKYDVIVFGFWDCNNYTDLSTEAAALVDQFLQNGGSAIFGHDTITANGCGSHVNFNSLASHVGLTLKSGVAYSSSTQVRIVRKGVFTEYPWSIGDIGTLLTIPRSHVYGQVANGNVWIRFEGISGSNDANKVYLSTFGTNAFIQTGHTNGSATIDEKKILANIVFYAKAMKFVDEDEEVEEPDEDD